MIGWAIYPITHHGMPVLPICITKTKRQSKLFLEARERESQWFKADDYYLRRVLVDVQKLGVQRARKRITVVEDKYKIREDL